MYSRGRESIVQEEIERERESARERQRERETERQRDSIVGKVYYSGVPGAM